MRGDLLESGGFEGTCLAMLPQELGQLCLRHAEVLGFERGPNLFAVGIRSGIVAAGPLMPHEVGGAGVFRRWHCFGLWHGPTIEQTGKSTLSVSNLLANSARSSAG